MQKDYENTMPYNDGWRAKSGSLGFKMSNDYLFRALLQKDEESLKNLVSAFIGIAPEEIEDVTVTNPIVLGDSLVDIEIHLDVHVIIDNSRSMDLEMQTARHVGYVERSLLYLCRSFDSLHHGDDYQDTPGIWQISFCDFCLFPDRPEFYANYMMINVRDPKSLYSEKLRISNVDLTHIDLATEADVHAGLVDWARMFKAQTWEELKMLAQENKHIEQAVSSAWQLSEDERIREQMRRRDEDKRYWNSVLRRLEKAEQRAEETEQRAIEAEKQLIEKDEQLEEMSRTIEALKAQLDNK
ncbi:MAG: Rpn family recombination-promoting nuclease/putative transposase [Lachnospiraceae bacterium]|nr:Rpn family recombination-promoting nuclease/putative transposase [Lachnospiraceae bacterium]